MMIDKIVYKLGRFARKMKQHLTWIYHRVIRKLIYLLGYRENIFRYMLNTPPLDLQALPEDIKRLKSGLDEVSCQTIDLYVYLHTERPLYYRFPKMDTLQRHVNFTQSEKNTIRQAYSIPDDETKFPLISDVFRYRSGLNFAPQSVIDTLKDKSAIVAGALWGDTPVVFSDVVKDVYGFEPVSFNIFDNFITNSVYTNIHPQNMGLFNETTELDIHFASDNIDAKPDLSGNILLVENYHTASKKIKVITIDDFIATNNIESFGLLQLDVEGVEYEIIQGAEKSIKKHKPIMLLAIYHNPHQFMHIKPLIDSWNLGYKFMIRPLIYGDTLIDTSLICYVE